jgi:hypothetical protein
MTGVGVARAIAVILNLAFGANVAPIYDTPASTITEPICALLKQRFASDASRPCDGSGTGPHRFRRLREVCPQPVRA